MFSYKLFNIVVLFCGGPRDVGPRGGGTEGAHIIIPKLNDFLCNSKKIELVQQIALGGLVQFVNSFNFFPNCTENHLICRYNYIGLLFSAI